MSLVFKSNFSFKYSNFVPSGLNMQSERVGKECHYLHADLYFYALVVIPLFSL